MHWTFQPSRLFFSLANVAVPGIQSTPSTILGGSTFPVVSSLILSSASESKFQSFPFYGCIVHLMSSLSATVLWNSYENRGRYAQYKNTAIFIYHWKSYAGKKKLVVQPFDHVLYLFLDFYAVLSDISTKSGIESTPSLILKGSTSADVSSLINISTSEG